MKIRQMFIYGLAVLFIYLALFGIEFYLANFIIEMFTYNYFIKTVIFLILILVLNPIITYLIANLIPLKIYDLSDEAIYPIKPDEDTLE